MFSSIRIPAVAGIPVAPYLLVVIVPFLLVLLILPGVFLFTSIRYRLGLAKYSAVSQNQTPSKPHSPPIIPYSLPFLGNTFSFLSKRPGSFWTYLFNFHPRAVGSCTILLGGIRTHILYSPSAVAALLKNRSLTRDGFTFDVTTKGMGVDPIQAKQYHGVGEPPNEHGVTPLQEQERINHEYLLRTEGVSELTAEFARSLKQKLDVEEFGVVTGQAGGSQEVNIFCWLRERMFFASTRALMGERLLQVYPGLEQDFFVFDEALLSMFFGIPKIFIPKSHEARRNALEGILKFHQAMRAEQQSAVVDPDGDVKWEPNFGSRCNRARQIYYESRNLTLEARAGFDLGFLFGLNSNAIPAAGWMLFHILDPAADKTLRPRVMAELERARETDGTLNIPILVTLPLMQSIYHEVLRLYVDVLVTRELRQDLILPLDDGKNQVKFDKGSIIMAPSWIGHRDELLWTSPPSSVFYPERFLQVDQETGTETFTTGGTAGKFFPFGGGKTICPGRIFAKQEIFAAVASVLLDFEFEILTFVDAKGVPTDRFPTLRDAYNGTAVMVMNGDLKVRIQRRER
jgi:cytochrome P450